MLLLLVRIAGREVVRGDVVMFMALDAPRCPQGWTL
jgi:hypothetical protein